MSRTAPFRERRAASATQPLRAIRHLLTAGDQAGRGWAKERAVELYREALGLVPEGGPLRRDVMLRLAVAMQAQYHLPDAERLRESGPS
jgi:hypothetical protein